ncbi:MAG: hypothetical protein GF317_03845 [Candidatus Lokiarchaeota archaeon]|nr:hypothetical protein [Candidatus Lokiarchaeota archaeon]MBD3199019.1 hypothetical protein [Candidatus Lokiarchaeota archaeon]
MKQYDVILIHPPRLLKQKAGITGSLIRGAFIFIPMGAFAIADYLEKEGFSVKIINYPLELYLDPKWNLASYLKSIDFNIVGIDFHWVHNAYGAIEVAKIVKNVNPNARVILGGSSASYYHKEILKYYHTVDGVIKGEGEVPLLKYVKNFRNFDSLRSIPNLTYRTKKNQIKINPIQYVAETLDNLNFVNVSLLEHAKEYFECSRDIMGISFNLPIGRGCPFNCPFCAGGHRAQQRLANRTKVILRSPELVVDDISYITDKFNVSSVFFGHGAYPSSFKYLKEIFRLIQKEKIEIGGDLEIWRLPFSREMTKMFSSTFTKKHSSISISPRTTSQRVQRKIQEVCDPTFSFSKSQLNALIDNSNDYNTTLRIWLTIGVPFQTRLDILKDLKFTLECIIKYGTSNEKPITIMNEPYYIFPGSPAHEHPERFGVKLKYNHLPQVIDIFRQTKMSFFYNVVNYDKKNLSATTIKIGNILFFIGAAPMFLTTGNGDSNMHETKRSA